MRFAIVGDIHLTDKQPKNRKDLYSSSQRAKIVYIIDTATQLGCDFILQPGDLFDHHTAPDKLKTAWIEYLKSTPIKVITVVGQHDLRYHTSPIENTPIGVLNASEVIKVLEDFPMICPGEDVYVYPAGWNQDVPEIQDPDATNILLTHRMIINDKLWESQEEFTRANFLLRTTKFDLIVSGDNHQSFHYQADDRWLINCGSLMRKNIDQGDHKPCFWIYDTETRKAEQHFIPVAPFEEVYDIVTAKEEKDKNETLEALVKKLGESGNKEKVKGLNFKKNLVDKVNINKETIHEQTQGIINGWMEQANAK